VKLKNFDKTAVTIESDQVPKQIKMNRTTSKDISILSKRMARSTMTTLFGAAF